MKLLLQEEKGTKQNKCLHKQNKKQRRKKQYFLKFLVAPICCANPFIFASSDGDVGKYINCAKPLPSYLLATDTIFEINELRKELFDAIIVDTLSFQGVEAL